MYRRTAVVALAMTAVLAPAALAADGDRATLDGQRRTAHTYQGELAGPTVFANAVAPDAAVSTEPGPSWCTPETCDQTNLKLRLPAGRQSGQLRIELTPKAGAAQMHLVVYDAEGQPLPSQAVCCTATRFNANLLAPGDYLVVVYDDAGAGTFAVDVTWKANRPHRTKPTR